MNKAIPSSAHPFFAIYEGLNGTKIKKFDTPEVARSFLHEKYHKSDDHVLGIYDFNNKQVLPDGLPNDDGHDWELKAYIEARIHIEPLSEKQARKNRRSLHRVIWFYGKMFAIVLATIITAGCINLLAGWRLNATVGACLAVLFFSAGTLGYLIDWHVKTFGGLTTAERVNERALIVCYILGTAATILSLTPS